MNKEELQTLFQMISQALRQAQEISKEIKNVLRTTAGGDERLKTLEHLLRMNDRSLEMLKDRVPHEPKKYSDD